jgi:hypothetical protein
VSTGPASRLSERPIVPMLVAIFHMVQSLNGPTFPRRNPNSGQP